MCGALWLIVVVALSAVFVALGFPILLAVSNLPLTIVYTALGLGVIWFAYLLRVRPPWRSGGCRPERERRDENGNP